MAAEGLPVEVCCRTVGVSVSGYYAWLDRPPSLRAIRHVWLIDMIREVHSASRSVYGARRVHAELRMDRELADMRAEIASLYERLHDVAEFAADRFASRR